MSARRALSLTELIVALIVLGVIAAIAVPRFGQAQGQPDPRAQLRQQLRVLRVAIDRYRADHGVPPAAHGDGTHPAGSAEAFVRQLCRRTDSEGLVVDIPHPNTFGPYLRDGLPRSPLASGGHAQSVEVVQTRHLLDTNGSPAAWLYNCQTGQIIANSNARDADGRAYCRY